ncbi:transcriptional activator NhaR [Ramlibacter tataouinensis]|uniref:transcriptional activator NhaR n=1 Tax=Ramlibacter tataouinensis TaxID=94132 RepID=UPI0005A13917|nr:transcriptional activator NhaR [Ramlibacter tataouinensis]
MNYKHLHYFWAVAQAGGVVKAGERLHVTPQTLSAQIKLLEERLGQQLLRKVGRGVELTAAGRLALRYADEIFAAGAELEQALRGEGGGRGAGPVARFSVGVADSVPKSIAYHVLEPAMRLRPAMRMLCSEGKLSSLLGELAVHRLDLVISDVPLPAQVSVKAFSHVLGKSGTSFFAGPALLKAHRGGLRFPQVLERLPLLLPGPDSAVRPRLEAWLREQGLQPPVAGEFDDSALVKAFGREGGGVFVAPTVLEAEIRRQYGVSVVGRADDLAVEFYAISIERRITHPAVAAITNAARRQLFT